MSGFFMDWDGNLRSVEGPEAVTFAIYYADMVSMPSAAALCTIT